VDARLVADVVNRRGGLLRTDPGDVGGWPILEKGTPYSDTDKDGISDNWELAHGLDPADPDDGQLDQDADGWTNFEEFLHELAGDTPAQ
jgi:pectate lyase